jgi:SAM-dependent methyltransferase
VADFISLPFYDLFAENGHVPAIRKKLPPLLAGTRRSILEIGAGTGLITTSLAEWTPAEIFALEPSAGMRGVLLSRLGARPELLERVTVLACDALSVDLDEPAEAMVMINVMYALEPDYRRRLWPVLAGQLEPGGLLVFTWRDGGPPAARPLQELGSRKVGRHTYAVLLEILESGEEAYRARYLHRISKDGKVISEEELAGHAYRPNWNVIKSELAGAGFTEADAPEGLLAWRLRRRPRADLLGNRIIGRVHDRSRRELRVERAGRGGARLR